MKWVAGNLVQDNTNNMLRWDAVCRTRVFIKVHDTIENRARVAGISAEFSC